MISGMSNEASAIVEARNLTVDFAAGARLVRAVCGVDLALKPGETLALLGESGSGKSVTLRALMRLHPEIGRYRRLGPGRRAGCAGAVTLSAAGLSRARRSR
jgi:peptide/nickel transport system ATP-binding protein